MKLSDGAVDRRFAAIMDETFSNSEIILLQRRYYRSKMVRIMVAQGRDFARKFRDLWLAWTGGDEDPLAEVRLDYAFITEHSRRGARY